MDGMNMNETSNGQFQGTEEVQQNVSVPQQQNVSVPQQQSTQSGFTPSVVTMPAGRQVQPVNCNEPMGITSLSDLQSYAKGTVVRFPDFAEGQPFVARVRRPSMLVLAKQGKIPNSLLSSASQLFAKGGAGMDTTNPDMLADVYGICEVIAQSSLIEPTYDEIINTGLELSDEQTMAIFNYTQNGVKALESFRKE